jgi:hypothetical protein
LGAIAVALPLSSCAFFRGVEHEADNPAVQQAGRELAERVRSGLRAGEEAAQHSGQAGRGRVQVVRLGQESTAIRRFTTTETTGTGTYEQVITHKTGAYDDGKVTEDEATTVKCIVDALKQLPDATEEIQKGQSIFQRGLNGDWTYTIISSNLKNFVTNEELDPCAVVLSALPGAGG